MKYRISSGDLQCMIEAPTAQAAALILIRSNDEPDFYWDSEAACKEAGMVQKAQARP